MNDKLKFVKEENDGTQIQMLKEMLESMEKSCENLKEIVKQQLSLAEIIEASDKKEEFKTFVKDVRKNANEYTEQIKTLEKRMIEFDYVIGCCEKEDDIKDVVNTLLDALGTFSR